MKTSGDSISLPPALEIKAGKDVWLEITQATPLDSHRT